MKRILAALVALCVLLVGMPVSASDNISDKCGDNLTWNFDSSTGKLVISGTGGMWGWSWNLNYPSWSWIKHNLKEKIKTVSIEEGVTSIGGCAFTGCNYLTDVHLPSSIETIGPGAFEGCTALENINIPVGTKHIGDDAFERCINLTHIVIPKSVTHLGYWSFHGTGLHSITIPEGVSYIHYNTFSSCESLSNVFIPRSVTEIYDNAFNHTEKLTDIYYSGNEREWTEIDIYTGNASLRKASIHFNARPEDMTVVPTPNAYKVYCNNSEETFDVSLEECMAKTSATNYNPQLAHMLIAMCNSVHNVQDMENTFDSFGFEQTEVSHVVDSGNIILGYGLAKKQLGSLGNEKTLVVITCRGTVNALEWVSNVDAAANNKHQHSGFSDAADALYKQVVDFVGTNDFSNVQFVITGHSRGAAAANILAARLVDESQSSNKIYAYTFACPDTAVITEGTAAQYPNIFNINNVNDPISWIPGSIWTKSGEKDGHGVNSHWNKYGKSYWFCEAWDDYKAVLEMPTSIPSLVGMVGRFGTIHPQNIYLDYLRKEWALPSRAYRNRSETLTAIENANAKRAQGVRENNIKNIYGVLPPESVTMLPEVTVFCPVDVVVYDSAGQMVGQVTNNVIGNVAENKVYICVSDEHKYIYLLDDDKYTIHLCGNDAGTMSYSVQNIDVKTYEITGQQAFKQVELFSGKEFISDVEVGDSAVETQKVKLYVAADNLPEKEVLPDGNGTEVPITSDETWSNPFRDVAEGTWYYDAVRFAYQNSLMSGTSANTFAPNTRLSRAMLAQILYNKEGKPQGIDGKDFPDVAAGAWYANAVKWAGAQGIVAGYGDGRFGPEDDITREQLATMLWRYDGSQQITDTQLDFRDAGEISSYAKAAMQWAVKNGVIGGKGNKVLDPKGFATRAEVAQILKNYLS